MAIASQIERISSEAPMASASMRSAGSGWAGSAGRPFLPNVRARWRGMVCVVVFMLYLSFLRFVPASAREGVPHSPQRPI